MRSATVSQDSRRATRLDVRMPATLREAGSTFRFDVDVLDLSVTGIRFETSFTLLPGNLVFLTIPGLSPLEAVVAWRRGFRFGCAFQRPLHMAVFDHIVAHYRAK